MSRIDHLTGLRNRKSREQGHSLKKYVSLADAAMYKAKRCGKDRIEIGDKDAR